VGGREAGKRWQAEMCQAQRGVTRKSAARVASACAPPLLHAPQPLLLLARPRLLLARPRLGHLPLLAQPLLALGLGLSVVPLLLPLAQHCVVVIGLSWVVLLPARGSRNEVVRVG
jgi:hypothetical protein